MYISYLFMPFQLDQIVHVCSLSGWIHPAGGRPTARSRQGRRCSPGERLRWKSSSACASHRRQEGRCQGRETAPGKRSQRRQNLQGQLLVTYFLNSVRSEFT